MSPNCVADVSDWTTHLSSHLFILDSDTLSNPQVQDKSKLFMRH